VVAWCAPLFWLVREGWDLRPGNQPARAFRMLRSEDPNARLSGTRDLKLLVMLNCLTPGQVDAAIAHLLVVLRDRDPEVREAAAVSLFFIVSEATQRSAAVPQVQAVATGLMEGVCDAVPAVRRRTALALASIYSLSPGRGVAPPPLPRDTGRFAGLLAGAVTDRDPVVSSSAMNVLRATAPQFRGASPPALVAALDAADPRARARVAWAVTEFPEGHDQLLPALLRTLERDPSPEVRSACDLALSCVKLTAAAVPDLVKALRSPEQRMRFRAADRLSYIVPRPVEVVPALLPVLDERFTPKTAFERKRPTWADPAVAATWALGAIAQGTPTPGRAEAALTKLFRDPEHPWRARQVLDALERICDDKHAATDPRSVPWRSHIDLGTLLMHAGKTAEAEAEYRSALAVYRKLADQSPSVDEFRGGQASTHNAMGILLSNTGKLAEAEVEYRSALALVQKLADDNQNATRFGNILAKCHNNLGILLIQTGRPAEAEAEYRTAMALQRKLVDDDPHDTESQYFLANTGDNLGVVLSRTGRPAEAEAEYRRALAIFQRLTGDNLEVPYYRHLMAECLTNIGDLLADAGRAAEAVDTYGQGRGILEALAGDHPTIEHYRNGLAFAHSGLGRAHRRAGAYAAAVADLRQAVALWERLLALTPEARYGLAHDHALLAGLAADDRSDLSPADGPAEADRATAVLRPLVVEGYRNPKMSTDPDFDPLRSRPDFPLFMMDLVMPAEPFADRQ
jgi:tetratricopeptide (TPR) repeat protein